MWVANDVTIAADAAQASPKPLLGPRLPAPAGLPPSVPKVAHPAQSCLGGLGLFSQICLGLLEFADHADEACEGFS